MEQPAENSAAAAALEQEIARLYRSEAPGMLRYAASLCGDAEAAHDAVQEAFFRFFIARSAGQQFQAPKAWLYRVLRNYIVDQKRSFLRKEVGLESALHLPSPTPNPGPGAASGRLLQRAKQLGLSAREVECFRLRGEGLRYEEIAAVLGLQSGTVGALLARAHGKIRQALGEVSGKPRDFTLPVVGEKRYAS